MLTPLTPQEKPTDRELLELAARAAQVPLMKWWDEMETFVISDGDNKNGRWWNPLVDDGDALRLVVQLGMVLHIDLNYCRCAEVEAENGVLVIMDFEESADKFAVTRRAIVLAAAEIGRAMPC